MRGPVRRLLIGIAALVVLAGGAAGAEQHVPEDAAGLHRRDHLPVTARRPVPPRPDPLAVEDRRDRVLAVARQPDALLRIVEPPRVRARRARQDAPAAAMVVRRG